MNLGSTLRGRVGRAAEGRPLPGDPEVDQQFLHRAPVGSDQCQKGRAVDSKCLCTDRKVHPVLAVRDQEVSFPSQRYLLMNRETSRPVLEIKEGCRWFLARDPVDKLRGRCSRVMSRKFLFREQMDLGLTFQHHHLKVVDQGPLFKDREALQQDQGRTEME
jgi:hypothetical protein